MTVAAIGLVEHEVTAFVFGYAVLELSVVRFRQGHVLANDDEVSAGPGGRA